MQRTEVAGRTDPKHGALPARSSKRRRTVETAIAALDQPGGWTGSVAETEGMQNSHRDHTAQRVYAQLGGIARGRAHGIADTYRVRVGVGELDVREIQRGVGLADEIRGCAQPLI